MDLFSKFIIEGDDLILAKVTYHNELVTDISKVRGGGMFSYDSDAKTFTLYGESAQFGRAELDDIRKCFACGNVYFDKYRIINAFSSGRIEKFAYRIHDGESVELPGPASVCDESKGEDNAAGDEQVDKDFADLIYSITDSGYSEIYRAHPCAKRQEVHYIKNGVRVCIVTENGRHMVYCTYTTWVRCNDAGKMPIITKTIPVPIRVAIEIIFEYAERLKNSMSFIENNPAYIVTDMTDDRQDWPEFPGEVNAYRTTREVARIMASKGYRVYAAFDVTSELRDESGIEHPALDVKTKRPGFIRRIFGGK